MTKQQKWILFIICIFTLIGNSDFTAVNLAVTPISRQFHASLNYVQWILSGYALACAIITIPAGRLADRFGAKKMFLLGTGLFTITSLTGALSPNLTALIISRVLQGFGIGIIFPTIYTIISNTYEAKQQGFVFGIFSAMIGLGLAIGPSLGGIIIEFLNWRWILMLNVPICLFGILLFVKLYKAQSKPKSTEGIDITGIILLGMALFASLYALNNVMLWGIWSKQFILLFGGALVLLATFIKLQSVKASAIMPLHLFRNKTFVIIIILFSLAQYLFASVLYVIGIYLENTRGFSPSMTGLIMLAMTLAYAVGPVSGKLLNHFSAKHLLIVSFSLLAVGALLLSQLTMHSGIVIICFALLLIGMGTGTNLTIFNTLMLRVVPAENSGLASGIYLTCGIYALSLGLIIPTLQLIGVSWHKLKLLLPAQQIQLTASQAKHLYYGLQHAQYSLHSFAGFNAAKLAVFNHSLQSSFVSAMSNVMWVSFALMLLGFVFIFFIRAPKLSAAAVEKV